MLTIPANMQTALKKNPNQEFRYIIKIGRSLVASPYTASNFYISSNATFGINNVGITDTSVYPVVPILLKEPDITEQLDIRAHTSTVGGFSIELDDNFLFQNPAHSNALEKFSDQLNTYNIYNRDLYIYLWLTGLTNLQTECLKMYHGIVGDVKISGDKIVIPITNSTFQVQRELPQNLISTLDNTRSLPPNVIGLPKSIVYGDHPFYYGQDGTLTNITHLQTNNMVKAKYLGIDSNGKHKYSISDHELRLVNDVYYRAWMFDNRLKRFVKIDPTNITYGTGTITIDELPYLYDYWYPDGTISDGLGAEHWHYKTKSCDLNYNTYSFMNIPEEAEVGFGGIYGINFPKYDGYQDDNDIFGIGIWGKVNYSTSGDPDAFEIEHVNTHELPGTLKNFITYPGGTSAREKINNYVYVRAAKTFEQNEVMTAYVYMVFKEIKYKPKEMFDVYIACQGRAATGLIASHFSELSEYELLENPVHIIDSIICEELGQTPDITSMQAVATELANWKIAPIISESENSKTIIEKIAKQCKSIIYWNASNKPAMDTFFVSNATDYTFQTNDIHGRPLLSKSSLSDIVNDFKLKYKKEGQSGNLQSVIERANNTAGSGSQAVYNTVNELVMDADYIADETTARLLADHWCKDGDDKSFWSVLHNVIEFETVDLRGVNFWNAGVFKPILGLELTDIIELHSDWDNIMKCYGESWAGKKFKITSITRKPWSLKIKAISL